MTMDKEKTGNKTNYFSWWQLFICSSLLWQRWDEMVCWMSGISPSLVPNMLTHCNVCLLPAEGDNNMTYSSLYRTEQISIKIKDKYMFPSVDWEALTSLIWADEFPSLICDLKYTSQKNRACAGSLTLKALHRHWLTAGDSVCNSNLSSCVISIQTVLRAEWMAPCCVPS